MLIIRAYLNPVLQPPRPEQDKKTERPQGDAPC